MFLCYFRRQLPIWRRGQHAVYGRYDNYCCNVYKMDVKPATAAYRLFLNRMGSQCPYSLHVVCAIMPSFHFLINHRKKSESYLAWRWTGYLTVEKSSVNAKVFFTLKPFRDKNTYGTPDHNLKSSQDTTFKKLTVAHPLQNLFCLLWDMNVSCFHEFAMGPYPGPYESKTYSHTQLPLIYILILSFHLCLELPKWCLPFMFSN